jgi:hypothetical protein
VGLEFVSCNESRLECFVEVKKAMGNILLQFIVFTAFAKILNLF